MSLPSLGNAMESELMTVFSPKPRDSAPRHGLESGRRGSSPRTQQKILPSAASYSAHDDDDVVTEHKVSQRSKQIQFGRNTRGFHNMMRLVESDPRLKNGGVLPLEPPSTTFKVSKRAWDVLARKWRRALHLFDDVFIDDEDAQTTTLAAVVEEQRLKWVCPRNQHLAKHERQRVDPKSIFACRNSPNVPTRLPVEESMRPILRSLDCYQELARVVPDHASSLTKGNTGVSPTDAGIKMFIAPSAETSLYNTLGDSSYTTSVSPKNARSPSPDMPVTPSTIAQMRGTTSSPVMGGLTTGSGRTSSPVVVPPPTNTSKLWVPKSRNSAHGGTAPSSSSSLSPFAQPFEPTTGTTTDAASDGRNVRNYSPGWYAPPPAADAHQRHTLGIHAHGGNHDDETEEMGSPAMRLEASFLQAHLSAASDAVTYAPPPPYVAGGSGVVRRRPSA